MQSITLKELIRRQTEVFQAEKDGFKLYPNAKYVFTKERAEEFSRVTLETLIDDPYFLGMKDFIWPKVKDHLLLLEEERKKRLIHTVGIFGAIGISKTSRFSILNYWQLFNLLINPDLNKHYDMIPNTATALIILSKDAAASKKVTFRDLLPKINNSPFIRDYFPPHVDVEKLDNNPSKLPSELRFPKNVLIFPGTGHAASILGYNVFGGGLDEVNDMQYTEHSKKATNKEYYSAAESAYNETLDRINSRFPRQKLYKDKKVTGFLALVGQARHPNSFSEKIIKTYRALGDESGMFVTSDSWWDVHPATDFSAETFYFDKTIKRPIEQVYKRHVELGKCVCGTELKDWAYLGNGGIKVCSIDCYQLTYGGRNETDKVQY